MYLRLAVSLRLGPRYVGAALHAACIIFSLASIHRLMHALMQALMRAPLVLRWHGVIIKLKIRVVNKLVVSRWRPAPCGRAISVFVLPDRFLAREARRLLTPRIIILLIVVVVVVVVIVVIVMMRRGGLATHRLVAIGIALVLFRAAAAAVVHFLLVAMVLFALTWFGDEEDEGE